MEPGVWITEVVVPLVAPASALLVAWLAGHRLSTAWSLRQKRREAAMALATQFFSLYGRFFALWKEWNHVSSGSDDLRQQFYARASANEGEIEALLVALAAERTLDDAETELLGRFRQGYQSLRNCIKAESKLRWNSASHPEYLAFKHLAVATAHLITSPASLEEPSIDGARRAIEAVTDNAWEDRWFTAGSFTRG